MFTEDFVHRNLYIILIRLITEAHFKFIILISLDRKNINFRVNFLSFHNTAIETREKTEILNNLPI